MSITEQHVAIAAKMYKARNSYRAVIGANWRTDLAPLMEFIQKRAKADGTDALKAGMVIAMEYQAKNGVSDTSGYVLTILAATVELVEPTPPDRAVPILEGPKIIPRLGGAP